MLIRCGLLGSVEEFWFAFDSCVHVTCCVDGNMLGCSFQVGSDVLFMTGSSWVSSSGVGGPHDKAHACCNHLLEAKPLVSTFLHLHEANLIYLILMSFRHQRR